MKRTVTFHLPIQESRRGIVFVLAIGLFLMIFAFTAFVVDIGYISLSRAQLQKSADAAALAATLEMYEGWGPAATKTQTQVATNSRSAASTVAGSNEGAGESSVYADSTRDVRLGNLQWDDTLNQWVESWGTTPYNLAEITLRRDQANSTNGDGPLDLFFAPVMGKEQATTVVSAKSALLPGVGLRRIPGRNFGILPITLDLQTWDNLIDHGIGDDNFHWNDDTETITRNATDNVLEVSLYPTSDPVLPPGNRGTVDFGPNGNSTSDISRQILYGLNDADISALGGEIDFTALPMQLNGDTGLSAGIKDELEAIKGEPRIIPIFDQVSGPGNNAWYRIVKFVPIRIMHVRLTGRPESKQVVIQPALYADPTVIAGETEITEDTIFAPVSLIE